MTTPNNVRGFLSLEEGRELFRLAAECPAKKVIVEVGAYYGKSTIWLGGGSKKGNRSKVYSVDWHRGDYEDKGDFRKMNTFPRFWRNIQKAGLELFIVPLVLKSEDLAKVFDLDIGLLFLDADHRYFAIKRDFDMWVPKLSPGGWLCLHDVKAREGPGRVYRENIESSPHFKDSRIIRNMGIAQKNY